jgi:hypothetical protein
VKTPCGLNQNEQDRSTRRWLLLEGHDADEKRVAPIEPKRAGHTSKEKCNCKVRHAANRDGAELFKVFRVWLKLGWVQP